MNIGYTKTYTITLNVDELDAIETSLQLMSERSAKDYPDTVKVAKKLYEDISQWRENYDE